MPNGRSAGNCSSPCQNLQIEGKNKARGKLESLRIAASMTRKHANKATGPYRTKTLKKMVKY